MIGNSISASRLSSIAFAPAASAKKEPEKATEPALTSEAKPSSVATGNSSGGAYLSSFDVEGLLQLNSEPPIDLSTLKKGLSEKEWLGEAIKRSKAAYAAGGESVTSNGGFTQKDIDTIHAATGLNVVVLNGGGTVVLDKNGNPPSEEAARSVQRLLGDIQSDRRDGRLNGEMTSDYLKSEFAKYSDAAKSNKQLASLQDEWLTKALDFISHPSSAKSVGVDTIA